MCPAGIWTAPSLNVSGWIGVWATDSSGWFTECHYFPFFHLWFLTSSKDTNRVREYGYSIRHVGSDAVGPSGVVPLRSALTPGQSLPKCSPVCICVFSLQVTWRSAHLRHAQLCPAGVCPVALPAAEDEGERPTPVYWSVCRSVHRRCRWTGVPVARRSHALGPGTSECYIALSPAASQAAEA